MNMQELREKATVLAEYKIAREKGKNGSEYGVVQLPPEDAVEFGTDTFRIEVPMSQFERYAKAHGKDLVTEADCSPDVPATYTGEKIGFPRAGETNNTEILLGELPHKLRPLDKVALWAVDPTNNTFVIYSPKEAPQNPAEMLADVLLMTIMSKMAEAQEAARGSRSGLIIPGRM